MQENQRDFFVVTPPGTEPICAAEMSALGLLSRQTTHGGISFSGGLRELYLANLWLRTASRVLVRLGTFSARDFPTLYKRLLRLPWGSYIKPEADYRIRVASARSRLNHSDRIAEVCGQAISRALGTTAEGASGSAATTQTILLRLAEDQVEVSIDSSGEHLHRRGYRRLRNAAPLRENLAAAALLACAYDGKVPLIDIMTGSGTFVIEAALIALHRPPGRDRAFAFMDWPKFRHGLWQQLLAEAQRHELPHPPRKIVGIDSNPKAIAAAQENIRQAGLASAIDVRQERLQTLTPSTPEGLLVGNPPYGERLGKGTSLQRFYHDLDRLYGETFAPWQGLLLCPQQLVASMKKVRFMPAASFSHGGIKVAALVKQPLNTRKTP